MCNLSEGILQQGVEQGIEKGVTQGVEQLIKSMLADKKTPEEIHEFCKSIPLATIKKVQSELLQTI